MCSQLRRIIAPENGKSKNSVRQVNCSFCKKEKSVRRKFKIVEAHILVEIMRLFAAILMVLHCSLAKKDVPKIPLTQAISNLFSVQELNARVPYSNQSSIWSQVRISKLKCKSLKD